MLQANGTMQSGGFMGGPPVGDTTYSGGNGFYGKQFGYFPPSYPHQPPVVAIATASKTPGPPPPAPSPYFTMPLSPPGVFWVPPTPPPPGTASSPDR